MGGQGLIIPKAPADMALSTCPDTPGAAEDQQLLAALRQTNRLLAELAARHQVEVRGRSRATDAPELNDTEAVFDLLAPEMAPLVQEQLRVLLLDTKLRLIGQRVLYVGNVDSTIVRVAEVLRPAVTEAAPCIILAHNHPSGAPEPSAEDITLTRSIIQGANLLDIQVLDHVVIGGTNWVSMDERGLMPRDG